MSQRFTIDRSSFEQVLRATSLIQQLNRQVRNGHVPDQDAPQPLSDLVEAQLAIETEAIDLKAAMNRVVGLAVKLSRATGAAIWLFSGHEFVYRAGTGSGANDERLQLDTLSELVSICGPSDHSIHDPDESNHWSPAYDAIHDPGSVKSLLVAPIYHGRSVVGALAVFSVEFNAFTECDATNASLLSGLLTHALGKAAEAELKQNVSLERATMLLAIDQLVPALRKLAKEKRESHGSPNRLPPVFTELEPGSKLTTVRAAGASTQEPGDGVLESSDSPSPLRVVTDRTEFELTDRLMMQTEKRDVADNASPPAYPAPEPKRARESTCAIVPPNILTLCSEALAAAATVQRDSPFWSLTGLTELAHRQLSKARFWLVTTTDTLGGLLAIATYHLRPSAPVRLRLKLPIWSLTGLTELAHRQLSKARFWLVTTTDTLGGLLAIATYHLRPSAPVRLRLKLPIWSLTGLTELAHRQLSKARFWLVTTTDTLVGHLATATYHLRPAPVRLRLKLPIWSLTGLTELAHRQLSKARFWLVTTTDTLGGHLAIATYHLRPAPVRLRLKLPIWSLTGLTELAHRQLSKARFWLVTTTDTLGGHLAIATYHLLPSAPVRLRLKLPRLSTAVVPAAVLLIMLVFLFSITRASHPSDAVVAPSETSTAANLMTTTEPSQDLHQRSGPFPAFKLSHMQVTDPAMSSALRNLSRHKIVRLRRRAAYGDDSAALLLGMAYETGHLVPQNCIKAREWVTESANEGNAAAQYNLGLRYRQGDGVPVNQEVGAQWLRKAAAQKYSQAQLALESVP